MSQPRPVSSCPWSLLALIWLCAAPDPAAAYYDPIFRDGFEAAYYVSATTGSDSNTGGRQDPWKTINRAVKNANGAPSGATVYVAPGTYAEEVDFARDNISLIGYTSTLGDQPRILADVPVDTSQIEEGETSAFPAFDPGEMPLVLGSDRASTECVDLTDASGVTIKNLNIRNCKYGVILGKYSRTLAENHRLFNVNVMEVGPTNGGYGGFAINAGMINSRFANGDLIENALIINSAAEGLSILGYETRARNVHVYSTDGPAGPSTDYYVIVYGSRNRIEDSYAWRLPGASHIGHGYTIKDNAEQLNGSSLIEGRDNLFARNVAVNMSEGFVVRHRGVTNNRFVDNVAYGTYGQARACTNVEEDGRTKRYGSNGITIRDGASDNTFIGTVTRDVCDVFEIVDTVEDGDSLATPPNGNLVSGLRAENSKVAIRYTSCPWEPSGRQCPVNEEAGENRIEDSVFAETNTIFSVEIVAAEMSYQGNCFEGLGNSGAFWVGGSDWLATITPGQFTNTRFVDINGYPTSGGWPAQVDSCDN